MISCPEAVERLQRNGDIKAEVDLLAEPLIREGETFGMVVGVLTRDGETQVTGYGKTGWEPYRTNAAPSGNTLFEIGSISKLFMAALVVELVNEGQLRYDETIRDILPKEVRLDADAAKVTVYELLTHTAGFPRQPGSLSQLLHFTKYLFTGHNLYSYIDRRYLYAYLRHCHLKPREERGYVYSNIGFGLLAHLIEIKTGRRVPGLIEEKICRPLNLRDTVFTLNDEQRQRLAVGHAGNQPRFMRRHTPMAPWDMGEIMGPTACLYSTTDDLLRFAKYNLGQLQHPLRPVLATMQKVQYQTESEDLGLGWIINRLDSGRMCIVYKHGMVAGYNGYIGMDPEQQIAVVVLSNTFAWEDKVGHNLVLRLAGAAANSKERLAHAGGQ